MRKIYRIIPKESIIFRASKKSSSEKTRTALNVILSDCTRARTGQQGIPMGIVSLPSRLKSRMEAEAKKNRSLERQPKTLSGHGKQALPGKGQKRDRLSQP